MSMSSIPSPSPTGKLYGWVEKIGNKVPHPFLLFIYLIVALMIATAILSALNVGPFWLWCWGPVLRNEWACCLR